MTLTKTDCQLPKIVEKIPPIEWYNLRYWVRETAVFDRKYYQPKKRPLTLKRIVKMFSPNLEKPIFIVGAPRSGTTFLGNCLAQLPEISYHFEPVVVKAASNYVYTQQWHQEKIKRFYHRVYAWLMRLHFDADLRLADKTPRNSLIVPTLYEVFPDAQFIFILRDGRDAALSLAKNPWYQNAMKDSGLREPAGYTFGPQARFWVEPERAGEFETTSDLHRCVWIWRQYVEQILEATSQIPQAQFHQLKYEDFVTHPEAETTRMLDFLGISDLNSRSQLIDFVTQNARADSLGSWQKELDSRQLEQIKLEAGSLLEELGYGN